MKTIIVPCDFSEPSLEAFRFATAMAAKTKSQVIVLYVIYIPVMYDPGLAGGIPIQYDASFMDGMKKDAVGKFEEMKKKVATPHVPTKLSVVSGDIIVSVIKAIEAQSAALVVMGTTGTSGWMETWIGSNTEKVVRHSPVPVIAIHKSIPLTSVKRILVPSLLTLNQSAFINKVKDLQELFDATLDILLVNTPSHFISDQDAKEKLDAFINQYKIKNYTTHFKSFHTEEEGIRYMTREQGVGLVAMATHMRKGLSHLFQGSVTEDVVNHLPCPVWTYAIKN